MQWSAMESAGGKIHQGATQVLQPATQEEDGDDIDCDGGGYDGDDNDDGGDDDFEYCHDMTVFCVEYFAALHIIINIIIMYQRMIVHSMTV